MLLGLSQPETKRPPQKTERRVQEKSACQVEGHDQCCDHETFADDLAAVIE